MLAGAVTIEQLLDGHVALEIDCLDRIYLNAYVPNLQVSGQVVNFLTKHLRQPIASPALFMRIGERFRKDVKRFAAEHDVPLLRFGKSGGHQGERKIDIVRPLMVKAERAQSPGVVAIGVAQEYQNVFTASTRSSTGDGPPQFSFRKEDRRVTCYYFYVWDDDFGAGFVKLCSYFPYPGKVWVNGHEWAKRQAAKAGIVFTPLSNGFATCADPDALQAICDRLGPGDIVDFCDRWLDVIPTPLSDRDKDGGYWWELSMRQVEVSRTLTFDAPRRARVFFEAMVRDNLGIGRPEEVELIFTGRRIPMGRPRTKPETSKTKIVTRGVQVTVNAFWKHSRVKQYLKDGRALRIETVINSPDDLGVGRRLHNLPQLQAKARAANHRMLHVQRAGQGCAIQTATFERIQQPYAREGRRTGALRFGDSRAMALAGALCLTLHAVTGFSNRSLRALVAGLLGTAYSANQMSYDLRRLCLHGLIRKLDGQNCYMLTGDGRRFAVFYTKLGDRVLPALFAADQPNAPPKIRQALKVIDGCIEGYTQDACLSRAA